ncbi:MAG: hypothetical protein HY689_06695 [Chloroflexi bacterium]|nr:hypothetical protein [Chloroflexota bacterium]
MVPYLTWHGAYVAHQLGACFRCYQRAQRAALQEVPLDPTSSDADFRRWQTTVETMAVFFHGKEIGDLPDGAAILGRTTIYM